jgi:hypothetical protein
MKQYLSKTAIWSAPTKEQIALDEKSIIIVYPQGNVVEGNVSIQPADPHGTNVGKYSASIWSISPPEDEWRDTGQLSQISAERIRRWEKFLSQDVLDLIRRNDPWLSPAELLLALPNDSEPSDR